MVVYRKGKHTTYSIGPVSFPRMRSLWEAGGAGREALREEVREALREELDVHSSFTWEKFLRTGLDAHFNGRVVLGDNEEQISVKPSDYWILDSNISPFPGRIIGTEETYVVQFHTKRAFHYPIITAKLKLPSLVGKKIGTAVYIGGAINGSGSGTGCVQWRYITRDGVTERLELCFASDFACPLLMHITDLPADYKTAEHVYSIHIHRNVSEYFIDGVLKAVGINSSNLAFDDIPSPPYTIFRATNALSPHLNVFTGVLNRQQAMEVELSPFWFRCADGEAVAPTVYRLYKYGENTMLAGLSIDAGSVTSHPFPVFGYSGKTIYFQADQPGTLDVEVLMETGNWRTYSSETVSADELYYFIMTGEGVLARITFTPTSYPCTINEAEAVLR